MNIKDLSIPSKKMSQLFKWYSGIVSSLFLVFFTLVLILCPNIYRKIVNYDFVKVKDSNYIVLNKHVYDVLYTITDECDIK